MINIRKLEVELWESADLLRQGSKLTSNQYCMPVLALLFLRYAYSRFKLVEAEILKNRPSRGGRVMPVEPSDMLDPACGSGGMFVQTGDFVNAAGMNANTQMTFYGQEKVEYNAQLCLMNMAVHGLNGFIVSGDEANSFYHDAFNLAGKCDYVIANPPFNVNKVKSESALSAGRLPFGLPGVNAKTKEIGNANYLWINYFYAYLNERGRAGFVMASSATDSSNRDRDIREQLVKTGHVDVMVSVGNNFFYTLSLPCSLWFFDKAKREENRDKVLFIDARKYYTVIDRTLNEWTEWQLLNLQAIVHLYRGETDKYQALLEKYNHDISEAVNSISEEALSFVSFLDDETAGQFNSSLVWLNCSWNGYGELSKNLNGQIEQTKNCVKLAEERLKKREIKPMRQAGDEFCKMLDGVLTVIKEYGWLTEKFGNGEYHDIAGLCKIATLEEIEGKNYSLTPGAYVGVPEPEDDGVDFHKRMNEIHEELVKLHEGANVLMTEILNDWEKLK